MKYSVKLEKIIWEKKAADIPRFLEAWTSFQIFDHKLIYFDYRTTTTPYAIDENGRYLGQVDYAKDNPKRVSRFLRIGWEGKDAKTQKIIDDTLHSIPYIVNENGRVYTRQWSDMQEYATALRKLRELSTPPGEKIPTYAFAPFLDKEISLQNPGILYDFDHEGNSLWRWDQPTGVENIYNSFVVISNCYGEVIKKIDLEALKGADFGAPDGIHFDYAGNIYALWMHTKKGAILYKYARTW